jgi:hypothetical protein
MIFLAFSSFGVGVTPEKTYEVRSLAKEVMNRVSNTDGRAESRARLTNGLANKEGKWLLPSGRGVQRKISRRVKPLACWAATCALLFSPCLPAQGGLLKADVDFSNYDVPLYEQIVNRIKAKVAARLGEGKNKRDRYFIVPSLTKTDGIIRNFRTRSSR